MLGSSDRFKGSTTTIANPGRWSLGACAPRLSSYDRQGQAGFGMGATTTTRRRIVLVVSGRSMVNGL